MLVYTAALNPQLRLGHSLGKLVGAQGESRFHPRRLVLLDQAFLDGAIHTAHCLGKQFLSGFGVLGLERRDKFLDLGSEPGAVVAVHCRLTSSATDSFDRGGGICHNNRNN